MKETEQYYAVWQRLYRAERQSYHRAKKRGGKAWDAWTRASRRLSEHENGHGSQEPVDHADLAKRYEPV